MKGVIDYAPCARCGKIMETSQSVYRITFEGKDICAPCGVELKRIAREPAKA